jgi:hypothetical protein
VGWGFVNSVIIERLILFVRLKLARFVFKSYCLLP